MRYEIFERLAVASKTLSASSCESWVWSFTADKCDRLSNTVSLRLQGEGDHSVQYGWF
jgi:hypothetical protein